MDTLLKNVGVSMAVSAVMSGLLITNLNAATAPASYPDLAPTAAVVSSSPSSSQPFVVPDLEVLSTTITKTPLDRWLDRLAEAESNGKTRIKVLDVNNRYSYGCLQFQMRTFKAYAQEYDLVDKTVDTPQEWEEQIYDCRLQKEIAKQMLLENYGNWRHWSYTVRTKGIGYPPKQQLALLTR